MKKIFWVLSLCSVFISCEKAHDLKNVKIDQLSVSGCKTANGLFADSIKYKTIDNYYLYITNINSYFNCDPGQLSATVETRNNTIIINETEDQDLANCICPYDFNFRVGPLDYGTYNITLTKDGSYYVEFLIDFTSNSSREFMIPHLDK